jgi:hypothetical protein
MEIIHVSNLGRNLHLLRSSIGWSQTGGRRCGFLTQMRPLPTRSGPQRFYGNFFDLRRLGSSRSTSRGCCAKGTQALDAVPYSFSCLQEMRKNAIHNQLP